MEHHADQGMQINIFLLVLLLRELKYSTSATICKSFWLFTDEHFKPLLIFQAEMLNISTFSRALKPGFGFILYH